VQANPDIERLVRNRWIWLAGLDPDSGAVSEWRPTGFAAHAAGQPAAVVVGDSAEWYQGKRGFLPPVAIVPGPSA
jgi:hypothetical protein